MKFTVTQEDIDSGIQRDCWLCPISRACARTLPELQIETSNDSLWVSGGGMRSRRFDLPENAQKFVYDFDVENPVKPFSFEIPDLNPRKKMHHIP